MLLLKLILVLIEYFLEVLYKAVVLKFQLLFYMVERRLHIASLYHSLLLLLEQLSVRAWHLHLYGLL